MGEDLWTTPDKLQHIIFCFTLTLLFSLLASTPTRTRTRHPIRIGSTLSISAGAAKEFADHLGFFHSSGASAKDFAADLLGVVLAVSALSLSKVVVLRKRKRSEVVDVVDGDGDDAVELV